MVISNNARMPKEKNLFALKMIFPTGHNRLHAVSSFGAGGKEILNTRLRARLFGCQYFSSHKKVEIVTTHEKVEINISALFLQKTTWKWSKRPFGAHTLCRKFKFAFLNFAKQKAPRQLSVSEIQFDLYASNLVRY
jgi:hypothetical protein